MVAHHAVLVIDVLGVGEFDGRQAAATSRRPTPQPSLRNLFETYRDVSRKNFLEAYHDAHRATRTSA